MTQAALQHFRNRHNGGIPIIMPVLVIDFL